MVVPIMQFVLSEKSELGEGEWHGVPEAVQDVDFLLAGENDFDGMTVFLKLHESLTADAAGRRGLLDKLVMGERSDGYRLDGDTGILSPGGIECGTLATDAGNSRILLISTDKHLAIIEHQSRPHLEITVGRIGV